jgi:hypothetical protein
MVKVSNEDKRYDYIVVVASDARGNASGVPAPWKSSKR